jgi:hypothetical protein
MAVGQLYVTGPANFFVGVINASPGSALYLGTAEIEPSIEIRPFEEEVFNDLGGNRVAFDTSDQGQDAFIVYELSRWVEPVVQAVVTLPAPGSAVSGSPTNQRGTYPPGGMGTLAMTEGQAITLFIQFPYVAKLAYTLMNPGYRFPVCKLMTEDYSRLGTRARRITLGWHARRTFDTTVSNAYGTGQMVLYDFNVAGLPAIT